jgi:alpha-L-fucosidase
MAKGAGMKYIVITTKHHDGFALFDSTQGDFNVMATPYRRDIIKALVQACRRQGIRIGFYHSIMDWHHPDYLPRRDWEKDRPATGADFERYVVYMKAQLKELLTAYGPIDILWFDGQWESTWTASHGRDLYAYIRSLQPNIVINNRVGGKSGDFGTPEQEIPATGQPGLDWETCMTMNKNWGYNRADKDFKPVSVLIRNLADIASKGGNFLLNVGPEADGRFPAESVERLAAIGRWMSKYGASIYGTEASPFATLPWGRATRKTLPGNLTRLYLHVFDWPADGKLAVGRLLNQPRRAFVLGDAGERALQIERRADGMVVSLPAAAPNAIDSVIVLDIDGPPNVAKSSK